jgi:peptidoglycan/LPS O-acetylase OafA/YrhL
MLEGVTERNHDREQSFAGSPIRTDRVGAVRLGDWHLEPTVAAALVVIGLVAQVVGAFVQAMWHALLGGSSWLTEGWTFLIDHSISNLGVLVMVIGAWQLHRLRRGMAATVVLVGSLLEVVGAVWDMLGHVQGGESRAAFACIGVGFLTAAGGVIAGRRQGQRESETR